MGEGPDPAGARLGLLPPHSRESPRSAAASARLGPQVRVLSPRALPLGQTHAGLRARLRAATAPRGGRERSKPWGWGTGGWGTAGSVSGANTALPAVGSHPPPPRGFVQLLFQSHFSSTTPRGPSSPPVPSSPGAVCRLWTMLAPHAARGHSHAQSNPTGMDPHTPAHVSLGCTPGRWQGGTRCPPKLRQGAGMLARDAPQAGGTEPTHPAS